MQGTLKDASIIILNFKTPHIFDITIPSPWPRALYPSLYACRRSRNELFHIPISDRTSSGGGGAQVLSSPSTIFRFFIKAVA